MELQYNEDYKSLFLENLKIFIKKIKTEENEKLIKKKYGLLFPMLGKNFLSSPDLLVFGRATNGWETKFCISNKIDLDGLIKNSIDSSTEVGNKCPLEWLWNGYNGYKGTTGKKEEYNFRKSSFWRVINKIVIEKFNRTDKNWTHQIAWSNLYKIAPAEGGNPSNIECNCQFDNSEILFWKEIDLLSPKYILLITDKSWVEDEFIKAKSLKKISNDYVQAILNYKTSKIIVTCRPERKNEAEFVKNVLKYLK